MKIFTLKVCLMVLMMLLTILTFAQVTITADNVPSPGTNFLKGIDDLPAGIDPGTPGSGKTWDFSMLISDHTIAYSYVIPITTPHPEYFPEANLALHSSDTAYSYLFYDQDVYEMQGLVTEFQGIEYAFDYTPDMTLFNFPFTFGDHLSQDYYFEWIYANNEDSVRFKDRVTRSLEVDAFGTVLLPSGPYSALRATVIQVNKDSMWAQVLGNWNLISVTVTESNYYDWYTDNPEVDISLVSFKYDENWSTLESVEFFKESYVGIEAENETSKVSIYPNPASDMIQVNYEEVLSGIFEIYNMDGQLVVLGRLDSERNQIDVRFLPPGIYFCRIKDENLNALYQRKILIK